MRVVYTGPLGAVLIPSLGLEAIGGGPSVDVPEPIAIELISRGDWIKARTKNSED